MEEESRNGDSGESEAMCSLPAKNMEKVKERSKLSSVHLSLEWDGGHMKLVPLSGDNLGRLDSSSEFWKVVSLLVHTESLVGGAGVDGQGFLAG